MQPGCSPGARANKSTKKVLKKQGKVMKSACTRLSNKKNLQFLTRKPPCSIRVQSGCTPKQFKNNAFRPPTDPGARRVHAQTAFFLFCFFLQHQKLIEQICARALRGLSGALRGSQKLSDALRGSQKLSGALRGSQRLSEALRGSQMLSDALRSSQMLSEAQMNSCVHAHAVVSYNGC